MNIDYKSSEKVVRFQVGQFLRLPFKILPLKRSMHFISGAHGTIHFGLRGKL
jgi:hypothetical protein